MGTLSDNLGHVGFSEEQSDLMEVAASFCRDRSPMEKVRKLINTDDGFDEAVWCEIVELGWLGVAIPEAHGGAGLSQAEIVPIIEAMGRRMLASPFLTATLGAQLILLSGDEAQQSEHLPACVEGKIFSPALMDETADWSLEKTTTAGVQKNGKVRLSGRKIFVGDAMAASAFIVSFEMDGALNLAIVDRKHVSNDALRRETIIDETKRTYEVVFDGVEIDESRLLDRSRVPQALSRFHLIANLLGAAELCGGAAGVVDYTIDYLNTRKQFGKLIGSYQSLKHPTVDAFILSEQARSHLYAAANSFGEQGTGEIATRMAKAQAEKALSYAADRSIQFHGGFGFTYDCDAQLYRRRAIWHASQYGDAAYHRRKLAELLF